MIRAALDAIPSTAAYELGWADALAHRDQETEALGEAASTRHARQLDGILDRLAAVEPFPHCDDEARVEREDGAMAIANAHGDDAW